MTRRSDKLPWSKFWWDDHAGDTALKVCSLAAQGLWVRLLCVMAGSDERGVLRINGRVPSGKQLASLANSSEREVEKLVAELEEAGVFDRAEDGAIISRRMVRDTANLLKAKEFGSKGGNPKLRVVEGGKDKEGVNPPLKADSNGGDILQEARSKKLEKEREEPPLAPPEPEVRRAPRAAKVRTSVPENWQPNEAGLEAGRQTFGHALGLELRHFADHHRAKGNTMADWDAAWRTWMANSRRFNRDGNRDGNRNTAPIARNPWIAMELRARAEAGDDELPFNPRGLLQ